MGNDTLTGDAGVETFYFTNGADRVKDLVVGEDLMFNDALWGGGAKTSAQIMAYGRADGSNVAFNFGNGHTLVIENATVDSVDNDLFSF